MKRDITIGEKYDPVLSMTTKEEAHAYFEACVEHTMEFGSSREEAESIERQNIGYYAGYADSATMRRVHELFDTEHPIFGRTTPSPQEAIQAGRNQASGDAQKE